MWRRRNTKSQHVGDFSVGRPADLLWMGVLFYFLSAAVTEWSWTRNRRSVTVMVRRHWLDIGCDGNFDIFCVLFAFGIVK